MCSAWPRRPTSSCCPDIGLGFLFLLAGYELDPLLLRQRPGKLAIGGWLISAVIAVGVTAGLAAAGYIKDYVPVGLALTTTALGTLLPILRDNDMLAGQFGRYVYAAGAVGELFPILIIAGVSPDRGGTAPVGAADTRGCRDRDGADGRRDRRAAGESRAAWPKRSWTFGSSAPEVRLLRLVVVPSWWF